MDIVAVTFHCSKKKKPFLVWFGPGEAGRYEVKRLTRIGEGPSSDAPVRKTLPAQDVSLSRFVCPWCRTKEEYGIRIFQCGKCHSFNCASTLFKLEDGNLSCACHCGDAGILEKRIERFTGSPATKHRLSPGSGKSPLPATGSNPNLPVAKE